MTGQIWHSFDFPTHVFFASHYQRAWWSLWEPRWFAGFDVASYPPLPHQIAAILGWLIGSGNAVNLLTFGAILVFPVSIYRLTRSYFGLAAAQRACILAVVTPSVLLAGYAFGQLPTLVALDAALFAAEALGDFLRRGGAPRYSLLLTLAGVTVATHHATFIFLLPPLLATVLFAEILTARQQRQRILIRSGIAAAGLLITAFAVIFPFWVWHASEYVSQVPIDHQSRHDFIRDAIAQDLFFWAEHGILPVALVLAAPLLGRRFRQTFPWYLLALLLGTIGLGGTTPVPRLLFGSQWAWLTYDRFSLWADVPLLMLLGAAARTWLSTADHGPRDRDDEWHWIAPWQHGRAGGPARLAWWTTIALLGFSSILAALMPALVQSEPATVDPRPIVEFLGRDGNDRWRYLTFGMGDQAAILNALTNAGTLDGEYFTARRLPILTSSGIGQIDFSLLWDPDARVLRELLADPRPYALRWVFTRDPTYEALISQAGWAHLTTLSNEVQVWVPTEPVPPVAPTPPRSGFLALWWGIVPLATLAGVGPAWWWVRRSSAG